MANVLCFRFLEDNVVAILCEKHLGDKTDNQIESFSKKKAQSIHKLTQPKAPINQAQNSDEEEYSHIYEGEQHSLLIYELFQGNTFLKADLRVSLHQGETVSCFCFCRRKQYFAVATEWEESRTLSRVLLYSLEQGSSGYGITLVALRDFSRGTFSINRESGTQSLRQLAEE